MSYAAAAAKGPRQSPEEARAPAPLQVEKTQSESTASLIDVDSPHVQSVHSNFENQPVKTVTQAERLEREAEEEAALQKANRESIKKEKAKAKGRSLSRQAENPVIFGNALLITAVSGVLGYGAYRKHVDGKLSWELVGLWSGAVGLFATADYFISKWLLQNKYPNK